MKETFLKDFHIKSGARFTEFAGWNMPVSYTTIIEEHLHTRRFASVFDVSHMSKFILQGNSAMVDIEKLITCRVSTLKVGQCRYGFFLNYEGCFIDDVIVYKFSNEKFMIIGNASTEEKDENWISENISENTELKNISQDLAKIDLQGPYSQQVISKFCPENIKKLRRFHFSETLFLDIKIIISRTGYTGEDGFEIYVEKENAGLVWEKLLSTEPVKPAGLGARDTLRLEMAYPLYGQDINENYSPVEANMMRFVALDKDFIGKKAIEQKLKNKPNLILTGFVVEGKRIPRHGYKIMCDKTTIGTITSGTYSPCLKTPIALGYIDPEFKECKNITIENDDIILYASIVDTPFLHRRINDSRKS